MLVTTMGCMFAPIFLPLIFQRVEFKCFNFNTWKKWNNWKKSGENNYNKNENYNSNKNSTCNNKGLMITKQLKLKLESSIDNA